MNNTLLICAIKKETIMLCLMHLADCPNSPKLLKIFKKIFIPLLNDMKKQRDGSKYDLHAMSLANSEADKQSDPLIKKELRKIKSVMSKNFCEVKSLIIAK
jgi:hypothetical protein